MKNLKTVLQGMIMGVAEIVPGVSGSTLALAMEIYEKFIDFLHGSISLAVSFFKVIVGRLEFQEFKPLFRKVNWKFGLLLILGMIISFGLFSNLVSGLIEHYPTQIYSLFTGLILVSIWVPAHQISKRSGSIYLFFALSFGLFFLLFSLYADSSGMEVAKPSRILLLLGGMVGISGMVLPGVSGAFILLALGLYEHVLGLVKSLFALSIGSEGLVDLTIFGLGVVFGFIGFVRILKWLLEKYKDPFLAVLVGVMVASIRVLFPFGELGSDLLFQMLVYLLVGMGIGFVVVRLARDN